MPPAPSPVARRRQVAGELRRARQAAGLTAAQAAAHLECSPSKIHRLETRQVAAALVDVRALADLYCIDGPARDALLELARQARGRGWWQQYTDMIGDGFATYIGLEDEATGIDVYEPHVIPGLLQTAGYARAVMATRRDDTPETTDRGAELRATRQLILDRPEPPALRVVIDEAGLRRPGGDMPGQYARLLDMAARPGVTLQVVPLDEPPIGGGGTAFTVLRFADPGEPAVVYAELLTAAYVVDRAEDVGRYVAQFDALRGAALDPDASAGLIRGLLVAAGGRNRGDLPAGQERQHGQDEAVDGGHRTR